MPDNSFDSMRFPHQARNAKKTGLLPKLPQYSEPLLPTIGLGPMNQLLSVQLGRRSTGHCQRRPVNIRLGAARLRLSWSKGSPVQADA